MAFKNIVFFEVVDGFNEDVIESEKPSSLYKSRNLDFSKEPGTLQKRKGSERYGAQIVGTQKDILGLYDFLTSGGSHVPIAAVEKETWYLTTVSGDRLTTVSDDDLIANRGD